MVSFRGLFTLMTSFPFLLRHTDADHAPLQQGFCERVSQVSEGEPLGPTDAVSRGEGHCLTYPYVNLLTQVQLCFHQLLTNTEEGVSIVHECVLNLGDYGKQLTDLCVHTSGAHFWSQVA